MTNPPPQPPAQPPGMPSTYSGQPRAVPPIGSPGPLPPPVLDRAKRGVSLELVPRLVGGLIALVGALAVWFVLTVGGDDAVVSRSMPTIGETVDGFSSLLRGDDSTFGSTRFYDELWATVWRYLVGLFLGASIGLAVGFASGLNQWSRGMLDPLASFFRMIPAPLVAVLALYWQGRDWAVILAVTLVVMWVSAGGAAEAATNHRRGSGSLIIGMATAVRSALVFGWWAVVGSEIVAGISGLGALAVTSLNRLDLGQGVALFIVIGLVGMAFESLGRLGVHLARARGAG